MPIEGRMKDTPTGDTGTRVHLKYLLHSAGVVAKAFGCQNDPVVPRQLPSA
ncbi:hypothetical protein [Streptomyces sp. NPDC058371]|uniref:hypothetical protein n=1 Tax=Streptomyces sp. NPDC058371 TaxID=3346463 RepID=UPI0036533FC7